MKMDEKQLLVSAKNGNKDARNLLFDIHREAIEKSYDFGPDGKHPMAFGRSYNAYGSSFRENSGMVFQWFCNAIDRFDLSRNVSFKSYLQNEINYRSMDIVRDRKLQNQREISESRFTDDESRDNAFDLMQREQAEIKHARRMEQAENHDMCDALIGLFEEGSKERAYLELYRELGKYSKNPNSDIAKVMNVSRQAVNTYKKKVQAKIAELKAKYGKDFLNRFLGR